VELGNPTGDGAGVAGTLAGVLAVARPFALQAFRPNLKCM